MLYISVGLQCLRALNTLEGGNPTKVDSLVDLLEILVK